ncbi:MAG: hypothetical protein AABY07_00560 [Nanoarchaeota archaeon]|jgi:hypothetical protein
MTKTIKINEVKCPKCNNVFETRKTVDIQCGKILSDGSRCGNRFDL